VPPPCPLGETEGEGTQLRLRAIRRPVRETLGKANTRVRLYAWMLAATVGMLATLLWAFHSSAQDTIWSEPVSLSNTRASSWFPALAVDGMDRVHVVWTENAVDELAGLATDSLFYSVRDGDSWSKANDLYTSQQSFAYTLRPSIVADRTDTLHLLYRYPAIIHYVRAPAESAWSAQAWSDPHHMSGTGESSWTDIGIDSQGVLHAIWSENVAYILSGGVSVLSPGDMLFHKMDDSWRAYTSSDGLAGDNVMDIALDTSGLKWFATDHGLSVLSAREDRWENYDVADGLASTSVHKILIDERGYKWLATQGGASVLNDGATPFDKSDDRWITYTLAAGLASDNVLDIAVGSAGEIWFATDRGCSLLSVADERWISFSTEDGLASDFVQTVLVDQAGYTWFGTRRGVSVLDDRDTPFDKSDDVWKTYTAEDGLSSGNVSAIASDDEGRIWFATASGLSVLSGARTPFQDSDDVWTAYSTSDGLPDDQVTAITLDADGIWWVGTATGVSVLSPTNDQRVAYTVDDGVVQGYITSIALDQNGNAWLGTWGGRLEYKSSDVFYRRSVNGGQSWSPAQNLSRSISAIGNSLHLHIDAQDVIHVVWDEVPSCGYISSPDGGKTWSQRVTFYSDVGSPRQIVAGVDGEGDILVVWRAASAVTALDDNLPIYYQRSSDGGITWSEATPIPQLLARRLNDTPYDAYDIAVDSAGHIHLIVTGRVGVPDTSPSTSGSSARPEAETAPLSVIHVVWDGNAWLAPVKIFSTMDYPERPAITVNKGNRMHTVWFVRDTEHLFTGGGDYQVWYSHAESAAPAVPLPPSPTPLPTLTPTPTRTPLPLPTPYPTLAPGSSGLPPGLYTETDEVLDLAIALSPVALLVLVIIVLRLGWLGKLFR